MRRALHEVSLRTLLPENSPSRGGVYVVSESERVLHGATGSRAAFEQVVNNVILTASCECKCRRVHFTHSDVLIVQSRNHVCFGVRNDCAPSFHHYKRRPFLIYYGHFFPTRNPASVPS